jgi:ubiquitin-protein ligase
MANRLLSVVGILDKINVEYSWLIENDDLWEQELLDGYHKLYKLNRKFMQSILQQIGVDDYPIQSPEFSSLTPIVQPESNDEEQDEIPLESYLGKMQKIEIALRKICMNYEELLNNNPNTTDDIKAFYTPFIRSHVQCVKSCKHTIYAHI